MAEAVLQLSPRIEGTDWVGIVRELGEGFAARAAAHDRDGTFVAENYAELRERRVFWAGIPTELGGGGADYGEMTAVIRELGRHCGSTALAFAMHAHPVAVNVYRYLRGDAKAEKALRKIAGGGLVIAGTGANDWLDSSGEAERVEGGYRVRARKHFVSGAPGAQLFVTSAVHAGATGREVLHFAVPFTAPGVKIIETWDALGMRGTGSHDVLLDGVRVPDEAIAGRRPAGVWHTMWDVVLPTAMPLITAAYVGMVEAAAALATDAARPRGAELAPVVGELSNALTIAQLALDDMVRLNGENGFTPSAGLTSAVLARKAMATEALKQSVELAAELAGGAGFRHGHLVERIVRDVRAMHFHPLPARRQRLFTGRVALGLDPVTAPETRT
jgi:alkylation response protein AidB-like acyl-CoA dehydrogenase